MRHCLIILAVLFNFTSSQDNLPTDDTRPWYNQRQPNWNNQIENSVIIKEASYFIVASRIVRPGQVYRLSAVVLQSKTPLTVRASIQCNGVEIGAASQQTKIGIMENLMIKIPPTSVKGHYKLHVEGLYHAILGGSAFVNSTKLTFSQRSMTIFIQTDKPIYMQGQTVNFRAIPIDTELQAFDNTIDVYMLDPKKYIMRRWLSRQSNLGTVSLNYQLSDQPRFGEWTIQVIAQGQVEEYSFLVEEYYQTRFEVNVTMPAFFFTTEKYLTGTVMANYTSGAPVHGNLTLKAAIKPINKLKKDYEEELEKYFTFDESFPFWISSLYVQTNQIPHLRFFNGVYEFHYPMSELEKYVPSLEEMEITVTATVGERFLDEVISSYTTARIFNSSVRINFLGGSPQVFKPMMPFTVYIASSFHDGSPLSHNRLESGRMEVSAEVQSGGGVRSFGPRILNMSSELQGVWEMKIDLYDDLGLAGNDNPYEILNDVDSMRIYASFKDGEGERAQTELLLFSHYSPSNRHIKVSTTTKDAKVGEYIIFHVQSNFFMESFDYLVMAKGIILHASQEIMKNNIRTFAVTLSAEMAPAATVLVYHIGRYGDIITDSLTFPVNGISRNNFTLFINNKKARTGKKVEVAIYGQPGAYVGLSGIDKPFYSMQAGNELTYAKVIQKMATFDEDTNGTYSETWYSHEGDPEDFVYFPSSTYGIDANRTFEYAGLIIFTDVDIPRRIDYCNRSLGLMDCLNGRCYRIEERCNGILNCDDGTDEANCPRHNYTDLQNFRKSRFNRIQRHYDNVWLWRDINIGPHGRYIFEVDVPQRPAHWMVSAFGMSPNLGFGMIQHPIEYIGVLPFYINVEMPLVCTQGEQVGVRVTVFNYMTNDIEAVVVLAGSNDYKFVHVEMNGIVRSYNPRTSYGEHQFFVYIKAQDAAVVYLPIVPTRLGDIKVKVMASTLIGKDVITRNLHVLADGLPQYRHQSILLDLSNRAYIFQYMHVNVTDTPIIPYDEDRYYIFGSNKAFVSVVGDVVGPIFPTMPVNASSLLHLPMDCAEQTIFSFAANMYTTIFMRLINQRNRTLEKYSFYHMNIGYQKALSFMNEDGSFSFFRTDWNHSSPSVWLTAYCARIFQEASFYEWENYIYIDPQVISKAVSWVLKHQLPEGSFYEVAWFHDRKINSTLSWPDNPIQFRNISLTAHVLIMLETVKDLTGGLGSAVATAQAGAIKWLERNLELMNHAEDPYEIAIVAYALMLSKATTAETAFGILSRHARAEGGYTYWGKEKVPLPPFKMENQKPFLLPRLPYKYDASNIETTSYALLVYVARQEIETESIMKWLNSQRLTDGGWASTQDTAWAMKALIEYTNRNRLRDVSGLTVSIEATALPGQTKILHVFHNNIAQLQRIEIPHAWGTVKVQAKGAGFAILQMSVQYNVDIPKFQTQPPVKAFSLHTRAIFHGRNQSHITYNSCQRWINLNESVRSGMTVLDVTIPTGYIIQQQKLDQYILARNVRNLKRAKFEGRKVLFYFTYLDNNDICVNFTVERWHPVANMSRYLPIRVYDYYSPERFNETIFDALPTYVLNICEVCGSSQCPYCPIYNIASFIIVPSVLFTLAISTMLLSFNNIYLNIIG
ncbi:CD109 antigen [Halyomorpha halys]|uniref:CD109 antigen n=1 Tax=Halyomorpha halys TaxID=286706 RepID=UPI0006D4E851|nr:CD109 antigen [Halyomorpha halys]